MALSKEKQQEYDIIVTEYQTFMKDHGGSVEAGDMKLLQEMMRLESKKAVFEALNDVTDKNVNVYGNTQNNSSTNTQLGNQSKIQLGPDRGLNPGLNRPKIDMPPQAVINALAPEQPAVAEKKPEESPSVEIDPKTGRKVYKGPKLRSRQVIHGVEHDHDLPLGDEEDE